MKWIKKDQYHIASGIYTICKIYLAGIPRYELWKREKGIPHFIETGDLEFLKQQAEKLNDKGVNNGKLV
jgi:hypothetical protein